MKIEPIYLESDVVADQEKRKRLLSYAEKRIEKASQEVIATVKKSSSNELLKHENWRSLKMELDRLLFLIGKLSRELRKIQKLQS